MRIIPFEEILVHELATDTSVDFIRINPRVTVAVNKLKFLLGFSVARFTIVAGPCPEAGERK